MASPFIPDRALQRREWLASFATLARLAGRRVPPPVASDRVPVLLIPGFLTGDWSMTSLARALHRAAIPTFTSGIKVNVDCTTEPVDRLERRLEACVAEAGRPVAVLGWSRGGSLGRMLTARRPDLVAGLITLASPLRSQLAAAPSVLRQVDLLVRLNAAGRRRMLTEDCIRGQCADSMNELLRLPFPEQVPFTSIYSRRDGVVDWRASLDPAAEPVEVATSHNDMGSDPRVLAIVVQRLTRLG